MLLEKVKGFHHGLTKIFLLQLVSNYTMLSWQLIKAMLIAFYKHLNIKAQFNLFGFRQLCS